MSLIDIGNFLDPLNLSELRQTENDKRRTRLVKAQNEYAKVWNEGQAKGLPMELLGYPKPVVQTEAAGMGGSGRSGGGFGFLPPIVPSGSGGGAVSENDIEEEEKHAENARETIRVITDADYVREPNRDASSLGDASSSSSSSSVRSTSRPTIQEYILPHPANSNLAKDFKIAHTVVSSNRARDLVIALAADKRFG